MMTRGLGHKKKYIIKRSDLPEKQWKVINPDGKEIYFGDPKVKNYTLTKNGRDKYNYIRSVSNYWDIEDMDTEEFWVRWILFNKVSFESSIEDTCKRFDISIVYPSEKKKYSTVPKGFKSLVEKAEKKISEEIISV